MRGDQFNNYTHTNDGDSKNDKFVSILHLKGPKELVQIVQFKIMQMANDKSNLSIKATLARSLYPDELPSPLVYKVENLQLI